MSEIQVLEELEHIRLRPDMYTITENPAHLLTEVIDNALDELANGFADQVTIDINNDIVSVTDNGRGIPRHNINLPDGTTGDSIIVACTKLFSGAKFNLNEYETSIGLHGVGLVVLNALCKGLQVGVKDKYNKKVTHLYTFVNAKLTQQFSDETESEVNWSTKVTFQTDPKYFRSQIIPIDEIKTRLYLVAAKYPNSNIILNGEKIPNLSIHNFCKGILGIKSDEIDSIQYKNKGSSIEVHFAYEEDSKLMPTFVGDVNLNLCSGTYLSTLTTLFYKVVSEIINDPRLTKTDVTNQLRLYCSLTIPEPKFEGQQKSRMIKDVGYLVNSLYTELKFKLNTFSIKERFKLLLDSKDAGKAIKKIQTKGKRLSGENPIADCLKIPGKVLYLLEGDSAKGTLKKIRNRATEAIMPLTGKIANTINKDINQALSSDKKMKYLLEAIGVGQNKFRYQKIKALCDADADGLHISVLACTAIWKFAPEIIKEGRLSIILPPLYGARKKGKPFIPIYKHSDIQIYRSQGYDIKRFKGLGEMQAQELKKVVYTNPLEYVVQLPEDEKDIETVTQCLVNTEFKRIICSDSRCGLQRVFDSIQQQ